MKNFLFLMALLCFTTYSNLQAQTESDEAEIQAFTHQFMSAYNQQDHAAIQTMYMDDAVRVDKNGEKIEGADQIAAFLKEQFIRQKTTLTIKQSDLVWSDAQHAFVAIGTYELKGATYVYDIKIHDTGAYANTMIKQDGKWKIAESVLTSKD